MLKVTLITSANLLVSKEMLACYEYLHTNMHEKEKDQFSK